MEVRANICRKLDEFRLRVNQRRAQAIIVRLPFCCVALIAVHHSERVSCGDETGPMLWLGQPARFMFRMKEEFLWREICARGLTSWRKPDCWRGYTSQCIPARRSELCF